jgi:hypothetical protein
MSASTEKGSTKRRQALMRQILQYLKAHPDAKDTVGGILKWWLPGHPIEWKEEEVQEILDDFVSKGWLAKRALSLSQQLYCLKKEKLAEIERFLQMKEKPEAKKHDHGHHQGR